MGAVARFLLSNGVQRLAQGSHFPWGTLLVNGLGSFLLGLLMGLVESERWPLPPFWRLLLGVGFLGAFTTFSTFSLETLQALRAGEPTLAIGYVLSSLALALPACWLGLRLALRL